MIQPSCFQISGRFLALSNVAPEVCFVWGADPLEHKGGFHNLSYDRNATFNSGLATNGSVKWGTTQARIYFLALGQAKARFQVKFPEIDWEFLQAVYGWSALQYQNWARGSLRLAIFRRGFYGYRTAPVILELTPGGHMIELRLIRDVRTLGAVAEPIIAVTIEVEIRRKPLTVDEESLLLPDVSRGKLGKVTHIQECPHRLIMEEPLDLSPYQIRPLIFRIYLGRRPQLTFSFRISYRMYREDNGVQETHLLQMNLGEVPIHQAQRLTYYNAGIVSYALLRPPPTECAFATWKESSNLPLIIALHGAGTSADSPRVREMLDGAYETCAWMLFPSGVTAWSGDDWYTWGAADIEAAVRAIPCWMENTGWGIPGISVNDWIVVGHSNGGMFVTWILVCQGAWFLATHYPDKVKAVAPVSGYSSIENYVPYDMWQSANPLLSSVLSRSRSSFKHELLLSNVVGITILQQHGALDDNVPAYHSRLMHDLLGQTPWPSFYVELPGQKHWFDGILTTPPLLTFYKENALVPLRSKIPVNFTLTIPPLGSITKYGICVDQLQSPDAYGELRVRRDIHEKIWYVRTVNIHRFHLTASILNLTEPVAVVFDDEDKHEVNFDRLGNWWFLKETLATWKVSNRTDWRGLDTRYGRQLGGMDVILRTADTFTIDMCSAGIEHLAVQISRNLIQYFAADSQISSQCGSVSSIPESSYQKASVGNVITLALEDDLPQSEHPSFPIRAYEGYLDLFQPCLQVNTDIQAGPKSSMKQKCQFHRIPYERGLGALFLRPLGNGRLELVVWGADVSGLEQATRLVPTLTGAGHPEFIVLSDNCRWKGHAGVYAAGHFDKSWQITSGSYIRGDAKNLVTTVPGHRPP
ncbi:uncharacterized protein ACLA_000780 [Aspergillus clavatus NRRL 1]|uniref:Peptidase S9 prolyl oligopeptidase catalytic domain-containing protein n=1 Tax=Aspergillus clavatus (strain ATCC 1007 / CBS 513.65 / DSM 816 / NCTC 3887 / NRRL 1 / QM 1276 / 107) TaxID=344612 RepID=A1C4P9_ASPCL|nr:uncharacterized protein ACLA_000780 [Aspergillus clavatus NRRL 1]EAW14667.1 conserved hypothetical protein [Aspergillus clavatus NRRL 1]